MLSHGLVGLIGRRRLALKEIAAPWLAQCDVRRSQNECKVPRFHQFEYAAQSWSQKLKVIARIEATDLGDDARFIVTNLSGRDKTLYEKIPAWRRREPDQGYEAHNALRQDSVPAMGGQPVPPLSA